MPFFFGAREEKILFHLGEFAPGTNMRTRARAPVILCRYFRTLEQG